MRRKKFKDFIQSLDEYNSSQELIRYNLEWKEMIIKHKTKKLIKDLEQKANEVMERSENEHRTDN